MLRTYLTLRGHILLDILQRHMYKVVNGHLQCRHTYICLAAIVRVSEPLNVLLPPLSIYRYRCTTMETLTKHRHLTDLVTKNNFIDFFLDKNANCNYFTTFVRRHVFFFNQISRVLGSLRGNKMSSLDFSLYNFVLTPVYSSQCDQQLTWGLSAIRATTAESFS